MSDKSLDKHVEDVMSMTPWQCAEALAYWERRARDAEEERNVLQQDLHQLTDRNMELGGNS